ncbi:MAG: hypothetical protein RLZZ01_2320, partial [Actinomycetota bacterium]
TTTGCTRPDDVVAATPCADSVRRAAEEIDIDEQKAYLDQALLQCRSTTDLGVEISRHPGLLGHGVDQFVTSRCGRITDPAILAGPVCAAAGPGAPTTIAVSTEDGPLFVGETLDGRTVELRPGPTIRFVGDVPQVIQQTVDIATESGCPGVAEQRNRWSALIGDPAIGDEASVYTRHADNVAAYLGCDESAPGTPTPETTG